MSNNTPVSNAVGDYLKAIWLLAQQKERISAAPTEKTNMVINTNELAQYLGVSAPSVTGMLGKLSKLELVSYKPYHGVMLTDAGTQQALRLIRRHRLIETFLFDYLNYDWDEVHDEAEVLEHTMSDRFTERLAAKLGNPQFDPHGDPIPSAKGILPIQDNQLLAHINIGEQLIITRIISQNNDIFSYLSEAGLQPGITIKLLGNDPLGHVFHLEIIKKNEENLPITLSTEMAQMIAGTVLK